MNNILKKLNNLSSELKSLGLSSEAGLIKKLADTGDTSDTGYYYDTGDTGDTGYDYGGDTGNWELTEQESDCEWELRILPTEKNGDEIGYRHDLQILKIVAYNSVGCDDWDATIPDMYFINCEEHQSSGDWAPRIQGIPHSELPGVLSSLNGFIFRNPDAIPGLDEGADEDIPDQQIDGIFSCMFKDKWNSIKSGYDVGAEWLEEAEREMGEREPESRPARPQRPSVPRTNNRCNDESGLDIDCDEDTDTDSEDPFDMDID